ncbi:MAG: acyl-CoA thioesterase [Ignavibacteriales bacterium]|nr:acyl-CoA thioesterase [Ignavibacteriaceae bacterium]QOJ28518.1 MAG: acyl-CoA thioesterase [Ignavibacteriales bacterium]
MKTHITNVRVRYADTDQMGFVYNGKYFEYFEVGRTELLRDNGLTYKGIEESGYMLPVLEVGIRYRSPAFYDELLEIHTITKETPSTRIRLEHKIYVPERQKLICEGFVELVFVDAKTRRPMRAPQSFTEAMKKFYE